VAVARLHVKGQHPAMTISPMTTLTLVDQNLVAQAVVLDVRPETGRPRLVAVVPLLVAAKAVVKAAVKAVAAVAADVPQRVVPAAVAVTVAPRAHLRHSRINPWLVTQSVSLWK